MWPEDDAFVLSANPDTIQDEIKRSRKDENAWPRIHYLWQQHPVLEWINDKVIAGFGRPEAPVLSLQGALSAEETVFILTGLVPNLKGHPLVHRWFGVSFYNGIFQKIEPFASLLARTGLGGTTFPNREERQDVETLRSLLPEAVRQAKRYMTGERKSFENMINPKLQQHLDNLYHLKGKHHEQIELFYSNKKQLNRKDQEKREIDRIFNEFLTWVEETMTTEDNPFIGSSLSQVGNSVENTSSSC